ncbi:MAG: hypothetical protein QXR68_00445 [Pyrobaculum sp.]
MWRKLGYSLVIFLLITAAIFYFYSTAPRQIADIDLTSPAPVEATYAVEINYTINVKISVAGVSMALSGWSVVGIGPGGNYTVGKLTYGPPPTEISFWGATEGGEAYVRHCLPAGCRVEKSRGLHLYTIHGVNSTVYTRGVCIHMGLEGEYVEEHGILDTDALAEFVPGVGEGTAEYKSTKCVYRGVPLVEDTLVKLKAEVYGQLLYVTIEIRRVATSIGQYSEEKYRELLNFVKRG